MKKGTKIVAGLLAAVVVLAAVGATIVWKQQNPRVTAKAPVSSAQSTVDTAGVRYIAHRGFSAVAPENTLPAITEAGKAGFWGVEFDIHETTDGKWVLMHDDKLSRMTNGSGKISGYSYAELLSYTYDNGANIEQYPNLKITLLDDALDACIQYGLHPCIEIKKDVPAANLASLYRLLQEKNLIGRCTVLSFELEQLKAMRALSSELTLWYLVNDISQEAIDACLANSIQGLDFDGRREANTPEQIAKVAAAGLTPGAWTIDSIALHDAMVNAGVRYITTNVITPH